MWKWNYTLPVAKIVCPKGKVIAIDEDQEELEQLSSKVIKFNFGEIIEIIKLEDQNEIPLANKTIDIVMLYNVTCCIIGQNNYPKFQELVKELHRATKKDGVLLIGIKEGKTMLNRIETALPLIRDIFILEKKEKRKYFDGEKLRNGIFYSLKKI